MRTKIFFILLITSLIFHEGNAQISSADAVGTKVLVPSADIIFKEACMKARNENKNVFIIFHASWCGWCRKMDTSMADPACRDFFTDNYVIEHLVVDEAKDKKHLENPGADEFKKNHGGTDQGLPYWLVFDKEGTLLADSRMKPGMTNPEGDNTGCPATEKEVEHFVKVLKETSKLNDQQLEIIRKRFRKNE